MTNKQAARKRRRDKKIAARPIKMVRVRPVIGSTAQGALATIDHKVRSDARGSLDQPATGRWYGEAKDWGTIHVVNTDRANLWLAERVTR